MKLHALRIEDGMDLYKAIEEYVVANDINAGFIVGGAAGLKQLHLRLPATPEDRPVIDSKGIYEVVSFAGTVAVDAMHIHISVADEGGNVTGGHLMSEGNIVRYTAEIGIVEGEGMTFVRVPDKTTGWTELVVRHDD